MSRPFAPQCPWRPTTAPLVFLVAILFLAAAAAEAGRLPRYGGNLRLLCPGLEPGKLDPLQLHGDDGALLSACLYEGLTRWGAERIEPALATRWFQSDDSKRWLFHLRAGLRFHDGSACDTQAVSAALHELASPGRSEHAWILRALVGWEEYTAGATAQIEGIYVVSATEMELHFEAPVRDLPARLALHPAAIVRRNGPTLTGTGPFRLAAAGGDSVRLLAFDGHRDGRPFLNSLSFTLTAAQTTAPDAQTMRRLQPLSPSLPSTTPLRVPARRLALALFHPGSAAFATPAARQMVAAAFDAPVFVRAALGGDGETAHGFFPDAAVVRSTAEEDTVDTAAPGRVGTPVRILVPEAEPTLAKLAERLQLHVRQLGFRVEVEAAAAARFTAAAQAGNFDIAILGWTPPQGPRESLQESTRALLLLSDVLLPVLGTQLPPLWRDFLAGRTHASEAALTAAGHLVPLVFFHDVWQASDGADNLQPAAVGLGLQNVHLRFVGP